MPRITLVPTGQSFTSDRVRARADRGAARGAQPAAQLQGRTLRVLSRAHSHGRRRVSRRTAAGRHHARAKPTDATRCCARRTRSTDVTVETREVRPAPEVEVRNLPCRIDRMERLADDVMAVFLKLPAVEDLRFRAGQYVDFILPGGRRRSFSIASAPADGRAARGARAPRLGTWFHGATVRHDARRFAAAHRGTARAVLVPRRSRRGRR